VFEKNKFKFQFWLWKLNLVSVPLPSNPIKMNYKLLINPQLTLGSKPVSPKFYLIFSKIMIPIQKPNLVLNLVSIPIPKIKLWFWFGFY